MIRIHRGFVSDLSGRSLLSTEIEVDNQKKPILVSVEKEYGKFLSPERADYALVGLLAYAMRNKHDIICEAPVTDELLYKIREILIPTLVRTDRRNYPVKIQADMAPPLDKLLFASNAHGGVGTGFSCGVDSFYTVLKYVNSPYPAQNLTHLCVFNIGAINNCYGAENIPRVKQTVFTRAEAMSKKVKLPLLKLESNFQDVFPQDHYRSHTYMDALAIYALQKLWRIYYYSSSNFYGEFSLKENMDNPPGYFEPFLLDCFSTSKLKIFSAGSECDRLDKIYLLSENPLVQNHLHVCTKEENNCGRCEKCIRTLLALDALGKLNKFGAVFDLNAYSKNRSKIYVFLYNQFILNHNPVYSKIFSILSNRHKKFFADLDATIKAQIAAQAQAKTQAQAKVAPQAQAQARIATKVGTQVVR